MDNSESVDLEEAASDGGITDGDDHIWSGNKDVLKGGGGWRDLTTETSQFSSVLGKHAHASCHQELEDQGSAPQQTKRTCMSEVIDPTHSSPAPEEVQEVEEMLVDQWSSSPIDYGSGDEHSVRLPLFKLYFKT